MHSVQQGRQGGLDRDRDEARARGPALVHVRDAQRRNLREALSTPNAPAAIGPYSQAIKAGGWLFVSGQIPLDPVSGALVEGGISEQTHRVLKNLGAILEAAGSSFDRVVKTTVYLADMSEFAAMNAIYATYFPCRRPRARRSRRLGCRAMCVSRSISSRSCERACRGAQPESRYEHTERRYLPPARSTPSTPSMFLIDFMTFSRWRTSLISTVIRIDPR